MAVTILVVDDSESVRQMLNFTLQKAGFKVIAAEDGHDALAKMTTEVKLVISDLNMPNLDGIGLVKEVRANPATRFLPVLMLTTVSQDDKKQEGRAAGATGWLVKPFDAGQLLEVVNKVLK